MSKAKEVITYTNKIGLWTAGTFILGFPHEARKEIKKTISVANWLGLDHALFYLLNPQPGTDVYEIFKEQRLLDVDQYLNPNISDPNGRLGNIYFSAVDTKNLTKKELQELLDQAYNSHYRHKIRSVISNPFQITRKIHSFEDFKYLLVLLRILLRTFSNYIISKRNVIEYYLPRE